jgi:low affinity Fe/Cu permease
MEIFGTEVDIYNSSNIKIRMAKRKKNKKSVVVFFENFANKITRATGRPMAFIIAFIAILAWGLSGPIFNYSDTWQLVINTSTTIITFLMVFLIQHAQNKDTAAIHLKLNELIATSMASNRLVDAEDLTSDELETLKKFYVRISELAQKESNIHKTHSIDEAADLHARKAGNKGAAARGKS